MLRVTITDLSRLPPERLAKLLLEWAARDRSLLSRLHGTIADAAPPDGTSQEVPPTARASGRLRPCSRTGRRQSRACGNSPT